eukprot:GFKZ01000689.1.p1 GENE.GFKZ01000689.1~~GFKZ01000689.1.p1  ORF type:complete len:301 (-),score=38.14 GFKZ01000689.1:145-1047(-)
MATTTPQSPLSILRTRIKELQAIFQTNRPELLSSATARMLTILALNPLDATKSRVQMTAATSPLALRAIRMGSPMAGVLAAIIAHAPGGMLAYIAYARLKSCKLSMYGAMMVADVMTAVWLTPLEAAKVRVQTRVVGHWMGGVGHGWKVWMGLGAQVARDVPFRLLHLMMYDRLSEEWRERKGREVGVRDGAVLGAIVGAVVGGVTTPLDVIKTRVMAQRPGYAKVYEGWWACASRTLKVEGPSGLCRGMGQRMVYLAASVAMFSVAYEMTKKTLTEREEQHGAAAQVFVKAPQVAKSAR